MVLARVFFVPLDNDAGDGSLHHGYFENPGLRVGLNADHLGKQIPFVSVEIAHHARNVSQVFPVSRFAHNRGLRGLSDHRRGKGAGFLPRLRSE